MRTFTMTTRQHLFLLPLSGALWLSLAGCSPSPAPSTPSAASSRSSAGEQAATHANDYNNSEAHADEKHADDETATAVVMDAGEREAAGIRLMTLQPGTPAEQLRAPGEVLDNAYGTTLISPRVEALIVRRHARLGDEVRTGAPLVTLSSVEVSDAQADLRIAEQEWRRVSALGREAVSGRRINEAQIAVERARAKARAYGLPGTSQGANNGQFTLTAPHAGRITEDDFVVGERIEPGRALYRLVDESVVWVDAKIPASVVPRIAVGSPVTIVAADQRLQGKVMLAAHRTSEATRNARVRIEVPNREDLLHGGDFVDVYLDAGAGKLPTTGLSVPTAALVQLQGQTVVFRRNSAAALEPVPVRTGAVIGDTTLIEAGVNAGDSVVVAGAFTLKARLLKAELGEGHGH